MTVRAQIGCFSISRPMPQTALFSQQIYLTIFFSWLRLRLTYPKNVQAWVKTAALFIFVPILKMVCVVTVSLCWRCGFAGSHSERCVHYCKSVNSRVRSTVLHTVYCRKICLVVVMKDCSLWLMASALQLLMNTFILARLSRLGSMITILRHWKKLTDWQN